jgi:aryl-alcohol dehydrogenase-like predicted oxidoreductase
MEIRACGHSGLQLSALGLGCWAFGGGEYWGESDQENVNRLVQRAYELGITYFDTA